MLKLAWRNLIHEPLRLAISVGGVALSILLILVMSGVFAGSEEHAITYIKKQPAPLWLMQAGVENMHMSSSIMPAETIQTVKKVAGVQEAVGLLYANAGVQLNDVTVYSYIFAVDPNVPFGGAWDMVVGTKNPGLDEVVIDNDLAKRYGLGLGDTVNILGYDLKIAGMSQDTFGIATSITFVNKQALALLMGVPSQAASYILVQPEPNVDLNELSVRLRKAVPDANLLTQDQFIASDKEMIRQMGADIIRAMNSVSYVVGLLVIALTVYTATADRAREYSVLKAIGANTLHLVQIVLLQASVSSFLGFFTGVGLAYAVAALIKQLLPEMLILIEPTQWLTQLPVLMVVTVIASLLPIRHMAQLDPMLVFKA
jgi:putative ABC transport system permease protein